MLWLEGSGTVADAKHNKRKAVEYQGRVGGENNKKKKKKSQQTERARNTSKMDWKSTHRWSSRGQIFAD